MARRRLRAFICSVDHQLAFQSNVVARILLPTLVFVWCGLYCYANSNIGFALPTARWTKSAFRSVRSNLSAKGRSAGVVLAASKFGSTHRTPLRARCPSALSGESARYHADLGAGSTMGRPFSRFAKRPRLVRRWSQAIVARGMRRTRASAAAMGSVTLRRWRLSTRSISRLTYLKGTGCLDGGGTAKSLHRFGNPAGRIRTD